MVPIVIYLITVNVISFLLMHTDKKRAILHRRRIPEITLVGFAVIGGSLGTLAGMYILRHKTRHFRFKAGIPLIITLQLAIGFFWYLLRYYG